MLRAVRCKVSTHGISKATRDGKGGGARSNVPAHSGLLTKTFQVQGFPPDGDPNCEHVDCGDGTTVSSKKTR